MKIIAAVDELPLCTSRSEPEKAMKKRISAALKTIPHADRASKIQIEFDNNGKGDLRLFAKPHFMMPDMLDDRDICFVGSPGFYCHESFDEEDRKRIEQAMQAYKCHPVFQERTEYSKVVESVSRRNVYELVQKNLNHKKMFEEYKGYNILCYEKIMEVYEEGDVIWVMDHNLLLVPGMAKGIPVGMSLSVPFSSLFKCIPFWEELFLSVLCCRYIEFESEASKTSFDLLASQKTGFRAGNPLYRDVKMPVTRVGRRGVDKDVILGMLSSVPAPAEVEKRRTLLLPPDSQIHLLGVEAYLSKYGEEVAILFLSTGKESPDGQTETLRLREYVEANYGAHTRAFAPASDHEFVSALRSCDVCHCPEAADFCMILGIPVIRSNPYDFSNVADEISQKIAGTRSDPGKTCQEVPGKMEWKKHFMTNFLNAAGIVGSVDVEPKKPEARLSLDMSQRSYGEMRTKKKPRVMREDAKRKEAALLDPNNREDEDAARIIEEFRRSKDRTLVLDYDGTLTDIVASPPMAAPTQEIKDLLVNLNKVCRIVICTGRSVEDSDKFFPREVEVFAEHGACHRVKGEWSEVSSFPQGSLDLVWRIAEFFRQRTPGSELEKKRTGYAFHYRNASPLIGVKQGKALFELLKRVCGDCAKEGNHIVEVRSSKKSSVMESVGKGFVLCAGDDIADEEMFEASPGYTIKVGDQETSAGYRIKDPQSFRMLLARLLE